MVVEVIAVYLLVDGGGAVGGGEAGQRAVGVDGGELLLGGSVRGAIVEAAARQHAAAGDHGAELVGARAEAGAVGGPGGAGQSSVLEVDRLVEDGGLGAGALRVDDRVYLGVGAAEDVDVPRRGDELVVGARVRQIDERGPGAQCPIGVDRRRVHLGHRSPGRVVSAGDVDVAVKDDRAVRVERLCQRRGGVG